ncbi:hypothetical protein [Pediococcus pentosaceus]|uniref:hypothetical protein n=1 Tax=Pediococcus pentosaceus TaxID=1255 RepID=UPI000258B904|nr:hypothetical protein [Pediococcus pentosaceus]KAF0392577.1 hypothetical protein GBO69_07725 [Pediococcus pentosaceus]KAF0433311.1 hypothetical protein GBO89_08030 [Pediococcus pentosaceus]KAF0441469.1 hypothetical protein GBO92_08230 [Pediococcus pentosaceus]MBF7108639.1 hypothetical protein [Pediococcus pentosaceus]MCE5961127.1 hypothetical protein [Pediococcus pentosaceus]
MKNNLPDLEDTNYKIIQVSALLSYVGNDLANLSDAVENNDHTNMVIQASYMDDRAFFTCRTALDLIEEIQKDVEACIRPIDEVSGRASN